MKIEQIYTGCLAQGAYYIESEGEAVVIDPLRDVQSYIDKATKNGARIKYIFETHFHADFVSGHLDLSRQTGAMIVYGPTAEPAFRAHVAKDGEELKLGKVRFRVLHTPGHTMESSCYLLTDENSKEVALFTGDTLFIGDVGRPDLAQKIREDLTPEILAAYLFDSLRGKIMPLGDDLIVYPAHGAGSACGKMLSYETRDTLGHQKKTNYALRPDMSKEEFIKELLTGLTIPPQYFPLNALMNNRGYESINDVLKRGTQPFDADAFEMSAKETGALILDTRNGEEFAEAFIPNSINIGIHGSFAPWVGTLISDIARPLLIVAEKGLEKEVVTRLARVGYDQAIGYLDGGFEAWKKREKKTDEIVSISSEEFAPIQHHAITVLDVRRQSEYDSQHLKGVKNAPLEYINDNIYAIKKDEAVYVHCASGYRSMIFASILKTRGYHNIINIKGGLKALKESGKFSLTDYSAPITHL